MRILLAHNSTYYPAHGGGDKSNRLLVEALAERGHQCRVVARLGAWGPAEHERFVRSLAERGVVGEDDGEGVVRFTLHGVDVRTVTHQANLRGTFAAQIDEFRPDVILTSTDDPAQLLLEVALRADQARVVYLARATLAVPFGPDCAFPSAAKTEVLRQVDGLVGVSQYVADYVRKWSGIPAIHVPISLMEPGPYAELGAFDNEFVMMVNPCAVKGITIFLGLAELFPETPFAAVPTWGTSDEDLAELRQRANVTVLDPVDDIDLLLKRCKVLLVPSLWAEARSRIVVEAMLRGVPVIASNVGGIPEAKMGVDYLLPVRPIESYQSRLDPQMVPVAEVPPQDLGPWKQALGRLLQDRSHHNELSQASRAAALRYANGLTIDPLEQYLEAVQQREPVRAVKATVAGPAEQLTPEKRRLLALRLRQRAAAAENPWFPTLDPHEPGKLRLFCFPFAGGGTTPYKRWADRLAPDIAVCPVRLPGREARSKEQPFVRIEPLIEALVTAMQPFLDEPFAFFGHSMGAGIAFELTRALRRRGQALPRCLIVSATRAPQLRTRAAVVQDPTDSELVEQLRKLGGIPAELLDNPQVLRIVLPTLRADTTLYRHYVYEPEEPLPVPLRAYGGLSDPALTPEQIAGWSEQTSASFVQRMFPGGHFFLQSEAQLVLDGVAADLGTVLADM